MLYPALVWNCEPAEMVPETAVLHFQGRAKEGMLGFWESIVSGMRLCVVVALALSS
jgi:hypothetical protein